MVVGIGVGVERGNAAVVMRKDRPPRLRVGFSGARPEDGGVQVACTVQVMRNSPHISDIGKQLFAEPMLDVEIELLNIRLPEVRIEVRLGDAREWAETRFRRIVRQRIGCTCPGVRGIRRCTAKPDQVWLIVCLDCLDFLVDYRVKHSPARSQGSCSVARHVPGEANPGFKAELVGEINPRGNSFVSWNHQSGRRRWKFRGLGARQVARGATRRTFRPRRLVVVAKTNVQCQLLGHLESVLDEWLE